MTRIVAYQGVPGAYGEEACRRFLPEYERLARPSFPAVVEAVLAGEAQRGVLPVENNIAGPVPGVRELLATPGIAVLVRRTLPVHLQLMALPGARLDEIETVASHPVALAQCAGTIERLGATTRQADNTALAALALAAGGNRREAVAASESAASAYGLTILRRDVHDRADNATDFCIIARERER